MISDLDPYYDYYFLSYNIYTIRIHEKSSWPKRKAAVLTSSKVTIINLMPP